MPIFPNIQIEDVVQVDDKTRIDATKTFISIDEAPITVLEIDPGDGSGFIDLGTLVSDSWFLDYQYASAGDKTVQVRVTTDGAPVTLSDTLTVDTAVDDALFSFDSDLTAIEPDILSWLPPGRNTFKNVHRKAQTLIMQDFDRRGYTDTNGDRLEKASVVDIEEVRQWSAFMTLHIIFNGISNAIDDIFAEKAKAYKSKAQKINIDKNVLRIDLDGDGSIDSGEGIIVGTIPLRRI